MEKTIVMNLSGFVFNIEESAYTEFQKYLSGIRAYFKNQDGGSEIIADIESRLSEVFTEILEEQKREVILVDDIVNVMKEMGLPTDMDEPLQDEESTGSRPREAFKYTAGKTLYRDTENTVVFGVCSGIAAYLGMKDPVWIRLLFVILTIFTSGFWIFLYLILGLILPQAITAADRLAMRGELVNVQNIEEDIRSRFDNLTNKLTGSGTNASSPKGFLKTLGSLFGEIIKIIGKAIFYFAKFFIIALGIIILISLMIATIAVLFTSFIAIPSLNELIYDSWMAWSIGSLSLIGLLGIPALYILYLMINWWSKRKSDRIMPVTLSAAFLWILSIVGVASTGFLISSEVHGEETEVVSQNELSVYSDTISIGIQNKNLLSTVRSADMPGILNIGELIYDDNFIYSGDLALNVISTDGDEVKLRQTTSGAGKNRLKAEQNIQATSYDYSVQDGQVLFDPFFKIDKATKFRCQEMILQLEIPRGRTVFFEPGVEAILNRVNRQRNTGDQFVGTYWESNPAVPEEKRENQTNSNMELIESFDDIQIVGAIELFITQGEDYLIQSNLDDNIDISIDNSTLIIETDWSWKKMKDKRGRKNHSVSLQISDINGITIDGASQLELSADLEYLDLEINGASEIDMVGDIVELAIENNGASDIELEGNCSKMEVESNGAGSISAFDFVVQSAILSLSGASDIEIHVTEDLDIECDGVGTVTYVGDPEIQNDSGSFCTVRKR